MTVPVSRSGMGHQEGFPPPGLTDRYEFREETIAGTHRNERDAPTTDFPAAAPFPPDAHKSCTVQAFNAGRFEHDPGRREGGDSPCGRAEPLTLPESSRTNPDDRLPRAPLGRVEGGDSLVDGRDV